jgi:hypothetical protein
MTQALYAHMNKKKPKKQITVWDGHLGKRDHRQSKKK